MTATTNHLTFFTLSYFLFCERIKHSFYFTSLECACAKAKIKHIPYCFIRYVSSVRYIHTLKSCLRAYELFMQRYVMILIVSLSDTRMFDILESEFDIVLNIHKFFFIFISCLPIVNQ